MNIGIFAFFVDLFVQCDNFIFFADHIQVIVLADLIVAVRDDYFTVSRNGDDQHFRKHAADFRYRETDQLCISF